MDFKTGGVNEGHRWTKQLYKSLSPIIRPKKLKKKVLKRLVNPKGTCSQAFRRDFSGVPILILFFLSIPQFVFFFFLSYLKIALQINSTPAFELPKSSCLLKCQDNWILV